MLRKCNGKYNELTESIKGNSLLPSLNKHIHWQLGISWYGGEPLPLGEDEGLEYYIASYSSNTKRSQLLKK